MLVLDAPSSCIPNVFARFGLVRRGKGGRTRTITWNSGTARDEFARLTTTNGGLMNLYGASLAARGPDSVGTAARVVALTGTESEVLPHPTSDRTPMAIMATERRINAA